ncbi:hypothetical protein NPIL_25871 [Nephila pilipes]|uniref:Uncharacterized protein n=1 Tax=Nephila pilipes TaxID=299642 RepID=A0A8X6NJK1_NEPPI|nr:hypothetical protein NPIL_25871 [Nephila pilipes]
MIMYFAIFLVIVPIAIDISAAVEFESVSSEAVESAVNAFIAAFSVNVKSSNTLTEMFDWRQTNGKQLSQLLLR